MLDRLSPKKLGFNHGELFSRKNPFVKGSADFVSYEEGYKDGIASGMGQLPGEAVFWGTLIILGRMIFQFMIVIQFIMLTFIPWMIISWILAEVLFFYTFGNLFPSFIKKKKGEH